MFKFSHHFNFYIKLCSALLSAIVSLSLVFILNYIFFSPHSVSWWTISIALICVLTSAYLVYPLFMKAFYGVDTFFYVQHVLKTVITLKEAKMISFLFDASVNKQWYPLKPIAKAPLAQRRQQLFEFAQNKSSHVVLPKDCQTQHSKKEQNFNSQQKKGEQKSERERDSYFPRDETYEAEAHLLFCLTILGLKEAPLTIDTLKNAYRKKMKEHHPDLFTHSPTLQKEHEEQSKKINYAYEYLKTISF